MAKDTDTVLLRCDASVARITLNRPSRHNALGSAELEQLARHLSAVASDNTLRVLLVDATGEKTFCAGAALDQLDGVNFDGDTFAGVTASLEALQVPTVCVLQGNVFGAGVDLALACDFRIGVTGSRMRVPAAAIGACYPPASVARMVHELGSSNARRLLLAAETFSGDALLHSGFLHWQTSVEGLQARVDELLQQLLALAPSSQSAMKQMIRAASLNTGDSDSLQGLMQACFASENFVEGMAAQREGRAAVFNRK